MANIQQESKSEYKLLLQMGRLNFGEFNAWIFFLNIAYLLTYRKKIGMLFYSNVGLL